MHSFTIVLLPPPFDDLRARANALLQRHRLDEDTYAPGWRTDYWTVGDETIRDEATERELGVTPDDSIHHNVCFVRNLAPGVGPSAVITPDGQWHDLFDFGWRFSPTETPQNRDAWERWLVHLRGVLDAHAHCVAIEFDTHS